MRVRAFKTGYRVSLDELNQYVDNKESQVDVNKPFRPTQMTKEQAKEKYSELYQRVVIDGNKNAKK